LPRKKYSQILIGDGLSHPGHPLATPMSV